MWFRSLQASWKSPSSRGQRLPLPHRVRQSPRLAVEHLEDRSLPSSYSAATVSGLITDINSANASGGSNTITLTAALTAPYVLTAVNNTTNGATGLPVIAAKDKLTIVGDGDAIERSTATGTPDFRLVEVASGGSLTLENMTLQGGLAECVAGAGPTYARVHQLAPIDGGGAIYSQGALVLNGVIVQDNEAIGGTYEKIVGINAGGGGIFSLDGSVSLQGGDIVQGNEAIGGNEKGQAGNTLGGNTLGGGLYASGSTVIVANSILDDNSALGGFGASELGEGYEVNASGNAYGGGLYVSGGTVNMTNATLTNNVAENPTPSLSGAFGYGGGLYLAAGTTAALDTATVAQITGNTASSGAAYDNIVGTYTLT